MGQLQNGRLNRSGMRKFMRDTPSPPGPPIETKSHSRGQSLDSGV